MIAVIVDALGMVPKNVKKSLMELKIRARIETSQKTFKKISWYT